MAEGATIDASSLQSRFGEIGDQIDKAHKALDRIYADSEVDKAPTQDGAESGAVRCQQGMVHLLERLEHIADRVGHL